MSLLERSIPLFTEAGIEKLNNSSVLVMGVGGVGSWCAEALCRSGVGKITVLDGDTVSETNRNRQLIALSATVGRSKSEVCAERLRDINPDCEVNAISVMYTRDNFESVDLRQFDFVADCIDTVTSKLLLIQKCAEAGVKLVSSMGTGNRLDSSSVILTDLSKTEGDPLARVMRRELKARGITHLPVVTSTEAPAECVEGRNEETGRATPSSACFVPATAGIRMANYIVTELLKNG